MRMSKALVGVALLVTALVVSLLALPAAARADDWTRVGSGGVSGGFNPLQCNSVAIEFNGDLYVGTGRGTASPDGPRSEVWRYHSGSWDLVNQPGFGNRNNLDVMSMAALGGYLYAGTYNTANQCQVFRSDCTGTSPFTWTQVNVNGFGDPSENIQASAMAVLDSKLYVGTYHWYGCEVWRYDGPGTGDWTQVNYNGFLDDRNRQAASMQVFNSKLYVGTYNGTDGCEVWRYDGPGPGDWTQVNTGGFGGGATYSTAYSMTVYGSNLYVATDYGRVWRTDGTGGPPCTWTQVNTDRFGDSSNSAAVSLGVSGSYLYAGTWNTNTGCELWRSAAHTNPSPPPAYDDWVQVNANGFGTNKNEKVSSIVFSGSDLYVSTENVENMTTGCEVWRTAEAGGPSPYSDWTKINTNGFGDTNNVGISSMSVYQGNLFAGTYNYATGTEIWRTDGTGGTPYTWTRVNTDGFGTARNRDSTAMTQFEYGGTNYLYVGTDNWNSPGCQVWRYNGSNWTQQGSGGFDNSHNYTLQAFAVNGGYLYAGVYNFFNYCKVYRTDGIGGWTAVSSAGFGTTSDTGAFSLAVLGSYLYVGTRSGTTGCRVWRSACSEAPPFGDWTQVNANGFGHTGSSGNYDASRMTVFDSKLYVGTGKSGSYGCEVWKSSCGGAPPFGDWTQVNVSGFGDVDNRTCAAMLADNYDLYVSTYNEWDGAEIWKTHATPPPPTVTSITPSAGTNTGTVSITDLAGTGFLDSPPPTVKLMKTGQTDIVASNVARVSPTRLTCDINLAGAAAGAWDVYVENNDGQGATLAAVFTVSYPAPTVSSITPRSGNQGAAVGITDLAGTGFYGTPVVRLKKAGQTSITATAVSVVSATRITCAFSIQVGAALGAWDVEVTNPDSQAATRTSAFTVNAAPSLQSTWYLAEGSTASPFSTYISIVNPNTTTVHAAITYLTGAGQVSGGTVTLPAKSQATVNPASKVGSREFSTRVVCTESKAICCDRTVYWTGPGASGPEAHSSVGVTTPATTWYLPEGSSAWGFTCKLALMNPNAGSATVTLTYMIEGSAPVSKTKTVGAWRRATFDMAGDIGSKDASIKVTSNIPVVPERSMYRNNYREGHCSIGTVAPAADFYLAEGTSAWGFTTYVLVQNPNSSAATVNVTYMTADGPVSYPAFSMAANSRKTLRVNDFLPNKDFSTRVHGSKPIIAERSMYWDSPAGEACHDSIGLASPHPTFWLADGQSSDGRETWTLVQNPNSSPVSVQVTYMTHTGAGNQSLTETIPANSRKTYNMADKIPSGRAAIVVTCKTTGKKIMVERAMYWAGRAAGTDTIGGYSD